MERGELGTRARGAPRSLLACTAGALLATAGLLTFTFASAASQAAQAPDAADRAATHAYLLAKYTYAQAVVANLQASTAAVEALADKLAGECPGALTGAPPDELRNGFFGGGEGRKAFQYSIRLGRMREELSIVLVAAQRQADRQAAAALAATVKGLHWNDRRITRAIAADAAYEEGADALALPNLCAELKAWAGTHFGALPAATKQLLKGEHALLESGLPAFGLPGLLRSYEGPSEKALVRKTRQLERGHRAAFEAREAVHERLERALGFPPEPRFRPGPPEGSVKLARGRTAAGESFTAWLEPKGSPGNQGCPLSLQIETTSSRRGSGGLFVGGTSSSVECLSRTGRPASPSVDCGDGRLTVTVNTLPSARLGRLGLSDGTEITSRLVLVPRRLGGPASYYFQVVRGPSPIPVSVAELDVHGKVLRTHTLPRVVECTEHPVKVLPGSPRTIVRDRVPGGPSFSIVGKRIRFLGKIEFKLNVEVGSSRFGGGGGGGIIAVSGGSSGGRVRSPFSWNSETGCRPHLYAIIYGILTRAREVVLARSAGKLYELRRVPIPGSLHQRGVLAYVALPEEPSEVIVKAPGGKQVDRESTGHPGDQAKRCETEEEEEGEEP